MHPPRQSFDVYRVLTLYSMTHSFPRTDAGLGQRLGFGRRGLPWIRPRRRRLLHQFFFRRGARWIRPRRPRLGPERRHRRHRLRPRCEPGEPLFSLSSHLPLHVEAHRVFIISARQSKTEQPTRIPANPLTTSPSPPFPSTPRRRAPAATMMTRHRTRSGLGAQHPTS